jgi:phosphopentomutase
MRGLILVIDAFGIGAAPDADKYGDSGAHTLRSVCAAAATAGRVQWPCLLELGLGNSAALTGQPVEACPPVAQPLAAYGAMAERSVGKDTTTGHWEIAGITLEQGFHLFDADYPCFPPELTERFEKMSGYTLIGNRAASGIEIIGELGEKQMRSKSLICYTSADSVFQVAAHEAVVEPDQLYRACRCAREICDDYRVARVIARPFTGTPGNFTRTDGRRDFSIELPGPSMLDRLQEGGVETVGIGKIGDIFNQQGLSFSYPEKGNSACLDRLGKLLDEGGKQAQLYFVNLVDTDMYFGHRRDPFGYYHAIAEIDRALPQLIARLRMDDFLIITADHGCDPAYRGSDHTREYVPLLCCRPGRAAQNLGVRSGFNVVAATVCHLFGVENDFGEPFLAA